MPKSSLLTRAGHFPDPAGRVSVVHMHEQPPMGAHRHEFVEIVVVLGGWGMHCTGLWRHEVREGDVLVIHGERTHRYERTQALHLVNVLVEPALIAELAESFGSLPGFHQLFTFEFVRWARPAEFPSHLRLTRTELREVAGWLEQLETETKRREPAGNRMAEAWLAVLVGTLARRHQQKPDARAPLDVRLGGLLARLERDPAQAITLEDMAREAGMSVRTFLRTFRRATGHAPQHYLLRLRIREAMVLLGREDERLSVTEIAFRCGFEDSNYFTRQFKRVYGAPPTHFRNRALARQALSRRLRETRGA